MQSDADTLQLTASTIVDTKPLDKSLERWHDSLPDGLQLQWIHGMRSWVAKQGAVVPVGSICTGSEIVGKILRPISWRLKKLFDIDLTFNIEFQCEINPAKRAHLQAHTE